MAPKLPRRAGQRQSWNPKKRHGRDLQGKAVVQEWRQSSREAFEGWQTPVFKPKSNAANGLCKAPGSIWGLANGRLETLRKDMNALQGAGKHLKAGKRQSWNPKKRHEGVCKVQGWCQSCRQAFDGWQTAVANGSFETPKKDMKGFARCRRDAKAAEKHLRAGKRQSGNLRKAMNGLCKAPGSIWRLANSSLETPRKAMNGLCKAPESIWRLANGSLETLRKTWGGLQGAGGRPKLPRSIWRLANGSVETFREKRSRVRKSWNPKKRHEGVCKVQEGGQSCREAFEGWQTGVLKPKKRHGEAVQGKRAGKRQSWNPKKRHEGVCEVQEWGQSCREAFEGWQTAVWKRRREAFDGWQMAVLKP